jgi:hypothetical protein
MEAAMYRIIFLILLSAASLFYTPFSYAESPVVGLVVWVTGVMKAVSPNSPTRILTRKSPVYESDTITTDKNGSGQIVFRDNSILSLRNDTALQIAKYRFNNKTPAQNSETLNLIKGGFRTITGAMTKDNPKSYHANTPVATIGVAGTVYSVFFDSLSGDLFTKLDKGKVFVSNSAGTITLSKTDSASGGSRCALNVYSKVTAGAMPEVVCKQPDVFLSEPPIIPVAFPSSSGGGGTVGSFCIS